MQVNARVLDVHACSLSRGQLQAAHRVALHHGEINLVSKKVTNVVHIIQDHGWPLQRQSPRDDADVGRHAHGLHHLRAEHARVANLHPLLELGVEAEDLHAGLRVRVKSGLEAQLRDADALEKLVKHPDEVAQREALVADDALNLVELRQVRAVHRFVAEHPVDGEILLGLEALLRQLVQHARGHRGGVRAHQVLLSLRNLPVVVVPN
mmetsp:Transcript_43898/g.83828  ORF Transcript_43898/g.83828 Transcript_43898/m.83828 type:complete len:208 (-) Transcript_43898:958-1581(-)